MANPIAPTSLTLEGWMEVPLPDSISWMPQTLGWKLIALVVLILFVRWGIWRIQIYRFNRYRREAEHAIHQDQGMSVVRSGHHYFRVLKITAQHVDAKSAPYFQSDFLEYLERSVISKDPSFTNKNPRASITENHWQSPQAEAWLAMQLKSEMQLKPETEWTDTQNALIKQQCLTWIKQHHNDKQPKFMNSLMRKGMSKLMYKFGRFK